MLNNLLELQEFNVSNNHLSGEIPKSMSGFKKSSFSQNPSLCGSPLEKCENNTHHALPFEPKTESKSTKHNEVGGSKMSPVVLIVIVVGDVLVLGVVCVLLYCCFWQSYSVKLREGGKRSKILESEKILYSSSPYPPTTTTQGGIERGQMVFFDGMKRFELEDLLRASAEMLGKGGFGTAYKAVLDDGNVVAVKRLKDAQISGKREFEQHMEVLGRLRHPNIVSLRAFYYAREERLLVYDYMPNGNLFWLLHGTF